MNPVSNCASKGVFYKIQIVLIGTEICEENKNI